MIDIDLNAQWSEALSQYQTLWVGFSGGLDSTVLLHSLATDSQLKPLLKAVHINHGISSNALSWQAHCQQICHQLSIPLLIQRVHLPESGNLEENARSARLLVFESILKSNEALLLAHHQNDQAETVLLQLFRGTGIDGLSGMSSKKARFKGTIIRPLLPFTRSQLLIYANARQLTWIEDESNENTVFSRNFIRQTLFPLIETRWPSVIKNLARTASLCQQAQENLEALANIDGNLSTQSTQLPLNSLKKLPIARQINVLRQWLKYHGVKSPSSMLMSQLIDTVIEAQRDKTPVLVLDNARLYRFQEALVIEPGKDEAFFFQLPWTHYPKPVSLPFDNKRLVVYSGEGNIVIPLGSLVSIRFRQGGEHIRWHGQDKLLKKLMQQWNIPPWRRASIPLLFVEDTLACVIGYAIADAFYHKKGDRILIE